MSNPRLVLATNNPGKIEELSQLLGEFGFACIPQAELDIHSVEENASTFIENALIKARHACAHSQLPAVADDSGLIVPALEGAPGLYSARFAHPNANAQENREYLLTQMAHLDTPDLRQAFYYSVIVFLPSLNHPMPIIAEATWRGHILTQEQGTGGFGYDSIFSPENDSQSVAQLSLQEKNQQSHRRRALSILGKALSFL